MLAAALFYIAFHALHGEQGIYALVVENYRIQKLESELAEVRKERMALEHKVSLLRDEHICPDLLDEQVRRYLGYADPEEMIVIQ